MTSTTSDNPTIPIIDLPASMSMQVLALDFERSENRGHGDFRVMPVAALRRRSGPLLLLELDPPNAASLRKALAALAARRRRRNARSAVLQVRVDGKALAPVKAPRRLALQIRLAVTYAGGIRVYSAWIGTRGVARPDPDVEPSAASKLPSKPHPTGCHEHWHWTNPPWGTTWTECHGNCPAPKDCRCGVTPGNRGFKICNGWVHCGCI